MTDKLTQQDVDRILKLIERAEDVAEFHLRYGDLEIGISRDGEAKLQSSSAPPSRPSPAAPRANPVEERPSAAEVPASAPAHNAVPEGMAVVKSPMVGTFYRAPAPGAPPFAEVGGKVEPETVVCIIEVMKLMNSIHAGVHGTVREIRVDDSRPVQYGQVLMVIEPDR